MLQKAKLFIQEGLIPNLRNRRLEAELGLVLVHIFLKMMLKVSWARPTCKDLMKIWDLRPDQNLKYQDSQCFQSQRANFFQKLEAKKARLQVYSRRSQRWHHKSVLDGKKNKEISKRPKLPLKKMLLLLMKNKERRLNQFKKKHPLI